MKQNKNTYDDNELIINYLKKNLEPDLKAKVEKRLGKDMDFRQEFKNMAAFYIGLKSYADAQTAGIDSFSLAEYAENPNLLDREVRQEIEIQLKKSPQLAAELEFLRHNGGIEKPRSFLAGIKDFLLKPSFQFRPAYALLIILLVAIPTFIAIYNQQPSKTTTAKYTLTPGVRAIPEDNLIVLDRHSATIMIEFSVATTPDALYDFEMYAPDEDLILIWKSLKPRKTFAFEVPVSYFSSEGIYIIKAKELRKDEVEERENFRLKVIFKD